jgi:hypothetical protein
LASSDHPRGSQPEGHEPAVPWLRRRRCHTDPPHISPYSARRFTLHPHCQTAHAHVARSNRKKSGSMVRDGRLPS